MDEQGTGKSFIAGIGEKKMAQEIEKQELELSSVEDAHREAFPNGQWISLTEKDKRGPELLEV